MGRIAGNGGNRDLEGNSPNIDIVALSCLMIRVLFLPVSIWTILRKRNT